MNYLRVVKMVFKKTRKKSASSAKLAEISNRLAYLENLEKRIDESIEHKLFELKAIGYVSLFLAAVLVALVLGVLIRALGV